VSFRWQPFVSWITFFVYHISVCWLVSNKIIDEWSSMNLLHFEVWVQKGRMHREVFSRNNKKLSIFDQIIVYNAFYSKLTFYIIKDRCRMHALKVFRSPVWLLLHKLSSPHYRYIRKMRRGDRLPLTQLNILENNYQFR
jgi:hypothetical protein